MTLTPTLALALTLTLTRWALHREGTELHRGAHEIGRDRAELATRRTMSRAEMRAELRPRAHSGLLTALPAVSVVTFLAFPMVSSIAFRLA